MYRLIDNVFEPVDQSDLTIDLDLRSVTPSGTLTCVDFDELLIPAQVQAGDVVGACIFESIGPGNSGREQLDLVGQDAQGFSVYSSSSSVGCDRGQPPPIVNVRDLNSHTSTTLHLSTVISKSLELSDMQ